MKNHIAILIGALALCSCEDYLTQENPNKIESEYYFTDEHNPQNKSVRVQKNEKMRFGEN